jgi:collagen type VII alpha
MDTGRLGVKGRLDASANSEALVLPRGTIAQRPTGPTGGMIRFNTNISQIEGWNGVAWGPIGSTGPTGSTGASGYSGYSGVSGFSGESGYSGVSGFSGESGYSGFSGIVGPTGTIDNTQPLELLSTAPSTATTTGALVVSGGVGIGGDVYVGGVFNLAPPTGAAEVSTTSDLQLTSSSRVEVTTSLFRVANLTTAQRDLLTASNGDLIYNSSVNRFQGYQAGAWINLDDGTPG